MKFEAPPAEPSDTRAPIDKLLPHLEKVRATGERKWKACCPAHEDRTPSLSITEEDDGTVLLHCFAGCSNEDICSELGLKLRDLFVPDPEKMNGARHRHSEARLNEARVVVLMAQRNHEAGVRMSDEDWSHYAKHRQVLIEHGEEAGPDIRPSSQIVVPARAALQLDEAELANASLAPRCVVDDYLYADLALLVAPGGVGKTTMILYEAVCVALGRHVWGLAVRTPGATLIVTAEDERARLAARLRLIMDAMDLSPTERVLVLERVLIWDMAGAVRKLVVMRDGNIEPTELAARMCEELAGWGLVSIVFDPLVSFGASEKAVNDNEQAIVQACRLLIKSLEVCVRLVAHTGKAVAREAILDQYASRGGSALSDGARMVHVMQPWKPGNGRPLPAGVVHEPDSSITLLARPKMSYSRPGLPDIWVKRTGFVFDATVERVVSDEQRERSNMDQVQRWVYSQCQQGMRHSASSVYNDLFAQMGLSRDACRRAVKMLLASGRLVEEALPEEERKGKRQYYLMAEREHV